MWLAFFLVVFCFMASFAFSEETSGLQNHSEVKPSKPPQDLHLKDKKKVVVGIFLSSITNFSLSKRTADLGFYVWWRGPYSDYNPVEHTEIVNSPDYKKLWGETSTVGNDYITVVRYFSQIRNNWEVTHFPFDRQEITISMEDTVHDIDSLQFIPDVEFSGISRRLQLGGWTITGVKMSSYPNLYMTNYGDPSKDESVFSRVSMVIELKRLGGRIFFNYFVGFFLAAFLCGMTFCVETSNLMARSNLTVASIFVAVGNKYILDQSLPLTSIFSLADAIQISTFLLITLTVSTNVACNFLHKADHSKKALFFNKHLGITMILCYVSYLSYMILSSIYS